MSTYFDFVIERNVDGECIDIANSYVDDNIAVINPYILKRIFNEEPEYTISLNKFSEDKTISSQTFYQFGKKIKHNDRLGFEMKIYYIDFSDKDDCLMKLNELNHSVRKYNDLCLWFSKERLFENKEIITTLTSYHYISDDFYDANSNEELLNIMRKWRICIDSEKEIGLIFDDGIYSLQQHIQYSAHFKERLGFDKISYITYFDNNGKEIKQYSFEGNVSFRKDVELMLSNLNKKITLMEKENELFNATKNNLKEIISKYAYDDSKLKKEIEEFCEDCSENYYDDEYVEESKSSAEELKLVLRFMGENGILIWNIN